MNKQLYLESVETYQDFLAYCDYLEELGEDTQLIRTIQNKGNYRRILCMLYPDSLLKQFKIQMEYRQSIVEEGPVDEIVRERGMVLLKHSRRFRATEPLLRPKSVLINHRGKRFLRQKSMYNCVHVVRDFVLVYWVNLGGD